jgi:hypothetical protein
MPFTFQVAIFILSYDLIVLTRSRALVLAAALAMFAARQARVDTQAVPSVTSPRQQFGASIGDDYFLVTYPQLEAYWKRLDAESDRMQLVDIGRTEEGRTQWMAIISAPGNLAQLDRYRDISRRLALAEGLADEQARALARDGRAIVWIDGGQHAIEVLAAQQLIELTYQLVSASDEETRRILQDVVVLAAHTNPDGHALVADWYMREADPRRRTLAGLPRLYQKYAGHDNNRDFYLSSQAETININRVLYREWFPQIVYNHHQAGPPGTVMFAPPFQGPVSPFVDPLIPAAIDLVGGAMHARFGAEGKRGVTMRGGGDYSMWWNGGLRTTAYFHNQLGLLTETIGSPTPVEIPLVPSRQVPSVDLPYPIAPQLWRFRQSIDYSMTANRAVLDIASRLRETFLMNAYRMGKNSIDRGTRQGPRAYILPAGQPDFLTATKFVDALLKAGVVVHRATSEFKAGGRSYPAGSYVIKTAQAFRPHVLDMFEPQDYAGPPAPTGSDGANVEAPYDITGWTLAFQMGVKFDRMLDAVEGPFEIVTTVMPPRGVITGAPRPAGYFISHHQNDAAVAVNRLLDAGEDVYWPRDRRLGPYAGGTGVIYVAARPSAEPILQQAASQLGVSFSGVASSPSGGVLKLRRPRVGLWDRYGGSATSGWTRWLLERYEFAFARVYAQELDAGDLRSRYDVLILPDEAVPVSTPPAPRAVPDEYRRTTGAMTRERTVPRLREFVNAGGTLVLIGDSTVIAGSLGVEVSSALTEPSPEGPRPLPREKYLIPGSVLRVSVDNTQPLAFGFEREVDVFFNLSPVFTRPSRLSSNAPRLVAWFASDSSLRSGWARGQRYLDGGVAILDAPIGRGRVVLIGPEINFRAQSHGTFKFLFNAIHSSAAE